MRAYLTVTGVLFGLLAVAHAWRTVAEWQGHAGDPWFFFATVGVGVLALALSVWAWRLRRVAGA